MKNSSDKLKNRTSKQTPINPKSMLPLSAFISYCKDNGLNIKKEDLEKLHKQNLVFPALKIYPGITEYKKTIKANKKKCYKIGSIIKSKDNWLDYYFKNKMIEFPSEKKFSSWKKERISITCTDFKKAKEEYIFMYSKEQILAIKIALPYLHYINKISSNIKIKNTKCVQSNIAELYKFLEIYYETETLFKNFEKEKNKLYKKIKNELERRPTKLEWNQEYDFELSNKYKIRAEKLIKKHDIDIAFLYKWRSFLAQKSLINESGRSLKIRKAYIKALEENMIVNLDEINYMIYITNGLLYFLTEKEQSVKEILGNFNGKICPICKSTFTPRNREQITCGNPSCTRKNKNESKKIKRRQTNIKQKGT